MRKIIIIIMEICGVLFLVSGIAAACTFPSDMKNKPLVLDSLPILFIMAAWVLTMSMIVICICYYLLQMVDHKNEKADS